MAWLASLVGVAVSVGFLLTAAFMNWQYGFGLGRSETDRMLFAAIAAGVDIMKVLLPFFLFWSFRNGRWVAAALSGASLLATMSYSIVGVAGFLDINRSVIATAAAQRSDATADTSAQVAYRRQQLDRLGVVEPTPVARRKLEGLQRDPRWRATRECSAMRSREVRDFCDEVHAAQVELAKSIEAERLISEIAALRRRSGSESLGRDGDHRSIALSRLTGWEREPIEVGLLVLLLVIIEGISTFGIFLSMNHGELRRLQVAGPPVSAVPTDPTDPEQLANDAQLFMTECLRPAEGQTIGFGTMYMMYVGWCSRLGRGVADQQNFEESIAELCERFGFTVRSLPDGRCCVDMAAR